MRTFLRSLCTTISRAANANEVDVPRWGNADLVLGPWVNQVLPGSDYGIRIRPIGNFRIANPVSASPTDYEGIEINSLALPPGLPIMMDRLGAPGAPVMLSDSSWYRMPADQYKVIPATDPWMNETNAGLIGDYAIDIADEEEDLYVPVGAPTPKDTWLFLNQSCNHTNQPSQSPTVANNAIAVPGGSGMGAGQNGGVGLIVWPHYKSLRVTAKATAAGNGVVTKWVYSPIDGQWCNAGVLMQLPTANTWYAQDEDLIAGANPILGVGNTTYVPAIMYQCTNIAVLSVYARMAVGG